MTNFVLIIILGLHNTIPTNIEFINQASCKQAEAALKNTPGVLFARCFPR
jgi:hypothetical protein